MRDELDVFETLVRRDIEAAQERSSHNIELAVRRRMERIQRDHLPKRALGFLDAMGVTCLHVDGISIDDIAYRRDPQPEWLRELHELRSWYAEVSDLANITINDISLGKLR